MFVRRPCLYTWLKRYFSLCHRLVSYSFLFVLTKQQFWDILCLSLNKNTHLGNSGGKDRWQQNVIRNEADTHFCSWNLLSKTDRLHFLKRENIPSKTLCCHEFRKLKLHFSKVILLVFIFHCNNDYSLSKAKLYMF